MSPPNVRKLAWLPTTGRSIVAWAAAAALGATLRQGVRYVTHCRRELMQRYEESLAAREQLARALEIERERARRDPLTGCLNHAVVIDELRAALTNEQDGLVAVALIDIDGLKATNDLYGHQVGDAALLSLAAALQQENAVVGRYGGDEFVVFLRGAGRDQAEQYRGLVQDTLRNSTLTVGDQTLDGPIIASVGLAIFPDDAKTAEDFLKLADNAMYAERRRPIPGRASALRFESDRVTKLISDIVPLLPSKGTRDEKLAMVAQRSMLFTPASLRRRTQCRDRLSYSARTCIMGPPTSLYASPYTQFARFVKLPKVVSARA